MPKLAPENLTSFDAFRAWVEHSLPPDVAALSLCNIDTQLLQWAYDHVTAMPDIQAAKRALLQWALESCSVEALSPAVRQTDMAAHVAAWWNEIDDCLSEYRETHGRGFEPVSCAHLVWFAVEWRANELAAMIRQILTDDDTENRLH